MRGHDMKTFIQQYIKSMRLYYSFVTGIAGWLGVSFYEHLGTDFHTVEILPSLPITNPGRSRFSCELIVV